MMMKRVSGWVLLGAIASTVGCIAATDPAPGPTTESTQKEPGVEPEMLPVTGSSSGGSGSSSGGTHYCAGDPGNPTTWTCNNNCPRPTCANGFRDFCSSFTDYHYVCFNAWPGGCTAGCAPLNLRNY